MAPRIFALLSLMLALSLCGAVHAAVAVLDFELNDLTPIATTKAEYERTAAIKPALAQAIRDAGLQTVAIPTQDQQKANKGFGYLFDHPAEAATLGKAHAADQIIVGRLHKPSYLFAYLIIRVIDVNKGELIDEFVQEAKGESMSTTLRAVSRLSKKIDRRLNRYHAGESPKQSQEVN